MKSALRKTVRSPDGIEGMGLGIGRTDLAVSEHEMDAGEGALETCVFSKIAGSIHPTWRASIELAREAASFEERRRIFLDDRFGALHFLQPVLEGDPDAFFTNGDDDILQRQWARENGMPGKPRSKNICSRRSSTIGPRSSTISIPCVTPAHSFASCRDASGRHFAGGRRRRDTRI